MTAEQSSDTLLDAAALLLQNGDLASSVSAFDLAEREGADADRCAGGRWMAHMYAGDFEQAWQQSDAIRSRGKADPHRFWSGEAIDGKRLIVRCLHGLGDAVQMLRYLPLLQDRCAHVTLQVPPRLVPLAPYFTGADDVITWGSDAPACEPPWNVQVEVMELPYLFRTTVQDLPVQGSYLELPSGNLSSPEVKITRAGRPKVGLVWSASEWDPTRCVPMPCLAKIIATPGIEFWNLQGEPAHSRARLDPALANVHDAAESGDGLLPLAACIRQMDLLISVDTLAAHLAGAMCKPAWVLLQHRADWSWMQERDDSPWYPTLRLWRQPMQDDWAGLTDAVGEALVQWQETWHVL